MWRHLTMLPSTSGLPDPSDLHSDSTVTDWHYNLYLQGEGEPECCSHIDDTWICTEKEEDIVKWALKNNISEKVPTQLGMRLLYLKKLLRSTFVHSVTMETTYLSWVSLRVSSFKRNRSFNSPTEKCLSTSSSLSTTQLLRAFLWAWRWKIFSSIVPVWKDRIKQWY